MRRLALAALLLLGLPAAGAVARPTVGGSAVVASIGDCLNTWFVCGGGGAVDATNAVILGAFTVGPDLTYRPTLITGVTITTRPFAVTYHIRPEAVWSDGVPVSASDFAFTYRAFVDRRYIATNTMRPSYLSIRAVTARGPKTVRVVFSQPDAAWRDLFRSVLPAHALAGEDLRRVWLTGIDDPRTGTPIGDGPFLVERYAAGQKITLDRNGRYWGAHKAYLSSLSFLPIPDGVDQADALSAGRVDAIDPQIEPQLLSLRQHGFVVDVRGGTEFEHVVFRLGVGGNPLLRRLWVRQAIAYGIDRSALVQRLFGTLAPSIRPLQNLIFVPRTTAYRPHWQRYRHDPARASRLLDRHGCRRGADGVYVCGGARLSFRFATTSNNPLRASTFSILREQLAKVGIELVPVFAAPPVFFGSVLQGGDYDLALFAWINNPDPGYAVDIWRCGGVENYTGYCVRSVTRQLLASNRLLNQRARDALVNRVDSELAAGLPAIPLYPKPTVIAYDRHLHGLVPNPTDEGWTWNVADWRVGSG